MPLEAVQSDYGNKYVGIIKGKDYSDRTAVFNLWDKDRNKLIDADTSCSVVLVGSDTHVEYVPAEGKLNLPPGKYRGNFVLSKEGAEERTFPFEFEMVEKEPD